MQHNNYLLRLAHGEFGNKYEVIGLIRKRFVYSFKGKFKILMLRPEVGKCIYVTIFI